MSLFIYLEEFGGLKMGQKVTNQRVLIPPLRLSSLQLYEWGASCDKTECDCPNPGICLGVIDYGMVYIGVSSLIALYPYGGLTPGPDRQN